MRYCANRDGGFSGVAVCAQGQPVVKIKLKRAYEPASPDDGLRLLVERLWPRGVRKEAARIDHWFKDLAPSPELRKWYDHQPERWPGFQSRYRAELENADDAVLEELLRLCRASDVTFVFAARDEARNSAVVLREFLLESLDRA